MPDAKVLNVFEEVTSQTSDTPIVIDHQVNTRADLDLPLNADGTFAAGRWVDGNTGKPSTGLLDTDVYATSPIMVTGSAKAIQDVVKGLLTVRGTNVLAPQYGTAINTLLHARAVDNIASELTNEITYLLGYLSVFNLNQDVSEQILSLDQLNATPSTGTIQVDMRVTTGSGQPIGVVLT